MLKRTTNQDPDFIKLREELDKELWEMYPVVMNQYVEHNLLPESTSAVLYFEDGVAVACGAFKPIEEEQAIEIKRMYVLPAGRGKGLSKIILRGLEQWGKELGYERAILETGLKNFSAHHLYDKAGYQRMENYPPFVGMEESWCYEKRLS